VIEKRVRFPAPLVLQTMVYSWQAMGPLMALTNEDAKEILVRIWKARG
jgi:hypothetical protein